MDFDFSCCLWPRPQTYDGRLTMPSRRTSTVETATATPATNGTTSEHDLEPLPDFPEANRRLETCDALSPWQTRCTFEVHSGSHSWQSQAEPDESEEAAQYELTGTSEPDPNDDFWCPTEAQFNKRDLLPAAGLAAIASRLIDDEESFDHLSGIRIDYFWRRRGGTQGGNPKYGSIKRPGLYEAHFTAGEVVYFVSLAADHVRDARLTHEQIEAHLHDLLCRTDVDPDDHSAYRLLAPDFVGSIRTLQRYGVYTADLREAAYHMQQLPLVEAPAAEPDEDDDF